MGERLPMHTYEHLQSTTDFQSLILMSFFSLLIEASRSAVYFSFLLTTLRLVSSSDSESETAYAKPRSNPVAPRCERGTD